MTVQQERDRSSDHSRPRPGAAVVVCAGAADGWDDLRRAVTSIRYQTNEPDEVVVVIDRAGPLDRARRAFPDTVVIGHDGVGGLAAARRAGARASTASVVVFLADDAVAERTWLERLLAPYADPAVVGTGGQVVATWDGGRPAWFPPELDWVVGCTHRCRRPEAAGGVRGGNVSFRREALPAGGTLATPPGRIVYEPDAVVHRYIRSGRVALHDVVARCHAEGRSRAVLRGWAGPDCTGNGRPSSPLAALPRGVARGVWDAARLDASGLSRAATGVVGAVSAARGYLGAWWSLRQPGSAVLSEATSSGDDVVDRRVRA